MKRTKKQWVVLIVLITLLFGLVVRQQALLDWWHLRGYQAPAAVAQLATDDTMTNEARHLFYVNRPDVTAGSAIAQNCPKGTEKTVVLGCYIGSDHGIYIYAVSDSRLSGVEQVTAAHEMLHAAYRRLSASERQKVDALLTSYYEHGLTDQRIKDTIAAYQKSEPDDVVNEMHSVFGTEVAHLPAALEAYYQRYFTSRTTVAAFTAQYQNEFTSRLAAVASYDSELKTIKQQIDSNKTQLDEQMSALNRANASLELSNQSQVAAYNQAVNSYNALLTTTKNLITQYNDIVAQRNQLALEEQQLTQELSASSLPASN